MAGKLIVFEGGEGSGKSTQAEILAKDLQKRGFDVLLTHEPGSFHSQICKEIRKIILYSKEKIFPWSVFFLFMADRSQHVEKVIKPALNEGKIVISDRYFGSTFAYQHFAFGLPLKEVKSINLIACQKLIPDISFLLNIPPKIGLLRIKKSGKKLTTFDKKNLEFHRKVNQGFLKIAQSSSEYKIGKWVVLDGQLPIEEIAQKVLKETLTIL